MAVLPEMSRPNSMRSRTLYCRHGFLVPGKPAPIFVAGRKVSPFCGQCWSDPDNADAFTKNGYTKDNQVDDACQYGFGNVLHYTINERGWFRDQHAFDMLESDLRLHLVSKREHIQAKLRGKPQRIRDRYVRFILRRKLFEIQRTKKHQARTQSYGAPEGILPPAKIEERIAHAWGLETENDIRVSREVHNEFREARKKARTAGGGRQTQKPDLNDDESQHAAQLAEAGNAAESSSLKVAHKQTTKVLIAEEEVRDIVGSQKEFDVVLKNKELASNPNLVIDLAADDGHVLRESEDPEQEPQQDTLSASIAEARREIETDLLAATPQPTTDREFFKALERIPAEEQRVIRLRYLDDGQAKFRQGKPHSRADIVRELRNNGGPFWSQAVLIRLEAAARLRLRGLLKKLPPAILRSD